MNVTSASTEFGSFDAASTTDMDEAATEHWTSQSLYTVTTYLWVVYLPIIFLLGAFGNVMTLIIMHRMTSEDSTINMYFRATAVMDLVYLLSLGLPQWLHCQMGGFAVISSSRDLLYTANAALYTGSSTISCWCLVCVTVHRAVSVVWPHRVNLLCTRRTVRLLIAAITLSIGSLYSYHVTLHIDSVSLVGNGSLHYCGKLAEDYVYFNENAFVYIDMFVYCLLPFLFIAVSNGVLVWKLHLSVKAASSRLSKGGPADQVQAREKAASSVTLTVVVVSTTFIVFTLPLTLNVILSHSAMMELREPNARADVQLSVPHDDVPSVPGMKDSWMEGPELARVNFIHSVCTLLSLTNSAVNFYLYCLTGRRFREESIKVMCCWRNRRRPGAHKATLHT
ncbi:hypothetical protein ACOMHN_014594 [Nucella lapillus]